MSSSCPPRSELEGLLAEQLDPAADAALTGHIEVCATCQSMLQELIEDRSVTKAPAASSHFLQEADEGAETVIRRLKEHPPTLNPLVRSDSARPRQKGDTAGSAMAAAVPVLPALSGYEVLEEVGRGGMGVIYKARHLGLNRVVAVKMLQAGVQTSGTALARLRAEAEAVARLQHPHILQIYEIGEHGGQPYLALEFAAGGSLRDHLDGTPWPAKVAAALIELVARAVDAAHAHAIVHRDLKPANILFQRAQVANAESPAELPKSHEPGFRTANHVPKVADFGLAKLLDGQGTSLTQTGEVLGTPSYMSPEQARPNGTVIGPWTDVYALGAVLYELLTGRAPFVAETPLATLLRVLNEEPVSVTRLSPTVPRDLETICLKCLEKVPWRRYTSARELAEDLRRFQANESISARPPSSWDRGVKFIRRHKALVGGLAATLIAMFLGTLVSVMFALGEAQQRRLAEANTERADANALQAEIARDKAVHEAYQARLAATLLSLSEHNLPEAREHLTASPPELRGWEWRHLHSRLEDEVPAIVPGGDFEDFFGPGKYLIASKPTEHKVRIVDAPSGAVVRELEGHDHGTVQQTAGGLILLLVKTDGTVVLMDEAGKVRSTSVRLPAGFGARALSPLANQVAAASGHSSWLTQPLLFDLATGKQISLKYTGHIRMVAFSPDGRLLAAACHEGTVRFFDTTTGAAALVLKGHTSPVHWLAFSPDGRQLSSASADRTLRQWDVSTGKELGVRRGHHGPVYCVAYSPDGQWIASGSDDRTVRLWRSGGGDSVSVLGDNPSGVVRVAFCLDGNHIATISADVFAKPARVLDARIWPSPLRARPGVLREHTSYVYAVTISPDGRWFASGGWGDKLVHLWDAASGEHIVALKGPEQPVCALAVSPNGRHLAARSHEGKVRVWDVATGRQLFPALDVVTFSVGAPENVAFSPDSAEIACGYWDRIGFWNLTNGKQHAELPAPARGIVRLIAFSPNAACLAAVVALDPKVYLLERATGRVVATLEGHTKAVHSVCFSPDGQSLLTASADCTLRLWDVARGEPLGAPLSGHSDEVFTALFLSGASRIVSGGRDRVVRIWDQSTGQQLVRLPGHDDYIFTLACSPDGATLVSGSGDASLRLWDTFSGHQRLKAGQELRSVRPQADRLVEKLFRKVEDVDKVVALVDADKSLTEPMRRAAWHAVLRRVAAMARRER
jgi:WD40 repeat protein/serine/threonine protein kinase